MKPKLIVSHIFPGSLAEKARYMREGMIITHLNGKEVQSIEDIEDAVKESLKTNFVVFKTNEDCLFVSELKELLIDEIALSKNYFYEINPVLKTLFDIIASSYQL